MALLYGTIRSYMKRDDREKYCGAGNFRERLILLKMPYSLPQEKHPRAAEANGERPE